MCSAVCTEKQLYTDNDNYTRTKKGSTHLTKEHVQEYQEKQGELHGQFEGIRKALFERNEKTTLLTTDLKGLGTKQPLLALSLSVLLFSLAGLPPSIGFFSKFYIFSAAIEQGFYWMTFVGVIGSVISVYYYLRPVVCMYMLEGEGMEIRKEVFFSKAVVYISALGVCILGLFSSQIFYYVQSSVANSL